MSSEKPYLNSKIIVVKDKYTRVYKLNEISHSPRQSVKTEPIKKQDTQELLQQHYYAYVQKKNLFTKNKLKNGIGSLQNQQSPSQNMSNSTIKSKTSSLPLLNIENKLKRFEEGSFYNSELAQSVLAKIQQQKLNEYGRYEKSPLPKIYNLQDIKKNKQELDSLQTDHSLLSKNAYFGFQDQSFQMDSNRKAITVQDETIEEKSSLDKSAFIQKESSRSQINNNSNYYFSSNRNSFNNQVNSIMLSLKKDSPIFENYIQQKSHRAKVISEIDEKLKQLRLRKKIHS